MKILFEIEYGFGKGQNYEVGESFVMEDTPKNRKDILEEHFDCWEEAEGDEDFISGKSNTASFERYAVDWDEATNAIIYAKTYEEKLSEITNDYKDNLKKLKESFEIEKE